MHSNVRSSLRLAMTLLLAVGVSAPSSAALISGDLFSSGDGLVTQDTATNLEWLDLTETLGISFNDALASSFVTSEGFTHATMAQVETLFTNAGFLTVDNVNNPLNDPAADLLIGLMGCTQFCGTVNDTGRGFAIFNATFATRPNYHNTGLGAGAAVQSLLTSNKDLVDVTAGHYLVRVIPEPSTALLLGLGLTGLVAVRRRATR